MFKFKKRISLEEVEKKMGMKKRSVVCIIENDKGELLLQKKSMTYKKCQEYGLFLVVL